MLTGASRWAGNAAIAAAAPVIEATTSMSDAAHPIDRRTWRSASAIALAIELRLIRKVARRSRSKRDHAAGSRRFA